MADNIPKALQELCDRVEIEKLAYIMVQGNDVDVNAYDRCLSDDVEIVYGFGQWRGLEEHKKRRGEMYKPFLFTQHILTNPIIDVNGDTAKAKYSVFAAHGMKADGGKNIVYAGAVYTHDLARTAKGWRIKRHHCETLWYDDPADVIKGLGKTA